MPIDNPYYIPKEIFPKVEEIRYLEENQLTENQVKVVDYFKERQNFIAKKSQLSPAARNKVIKRYGADYLSERAFTNDLALMEMYGPGFWEEFGRGTWEVVKFGGKVGGGIAIGAAVAATGPFSIPLGVAVAAEGYCLKKAAEKSDNPIVQGAVGYIGDTVMGGGIGGVSSAVMGAASSSLASKGANLALNSALTNGSEELLRVWLYTKAAQMGYELGSRSKQALEGFASFYHGTHKGRGVDYERECPICNGNFGKYFWL